MIDPLELQAATMDDLDEDEEPAPTVVQVWQQGQAEACWLFLSSSRQGYDTCRKNCLTRETSRLQVEA